ncbi:MAG TPA: hypothetical protein VF927_06280 [Solirubrobacteraceae bacterium]
MSAPTPSEPEAVQDALQLLDYHFFGTGSNNEEHTRAAVLRENVIRLIIFDMHLAIEELLRSRVFDALGPRSALGREQTIAYVKDLTSRQVLDLAVELGVIDAPRYERLRELNGLRNKAAHHWDLNRRVRRGDADARDRPLAWDGRPLTPDALRNEFLPTYREIYASMLSAWTEAHHDELDQPAGR